MLDYIKSLSKHSINYSISQFLSKLTLFLLTFFYIRVFTPNQYGILATFLVVVAIARVIFPLGQDSSVVRFYYDYRMNAEQLKKYIGTIISFSIGWALIIFLISLAGRNYLERLTHIKYFPYILAALLVAFFCTIPQFKYSLFRVIEESKKYLLWSGVQSIIIFFSTLLLIFIFKLGLLGAIVAIIVTNAAIFMIFNYLLTKEYTFAFDTKAFKESLKFGIPLVPHQLSNWILTAADRLLLNTYKSLSRTGVYTFGYNIGGIIYIIIMGINQAWAPFLFDLISKKKENAKPIISILTTYYVILIATLGLVVSLFASEFIGLVAPSNYQEASKVTPIIAFSFVLHGMYFMVVNPIFYFKKTVLIPIATFSSAVINVIFNVILIPKFDVIGAAWATLISNFCLFLITYWISIKIFPIPYEYKRLIKIILIVGISLLIFSQLSNFTTDLFHIILAKVSILFVYTLLIFSLVITKREIREIKKIWIHLLKKQ